MFGITDSLKRRLIFLFAAFSAFSLAIGGNAYAAEPVKIGLILPMTGPFASTGMQIETAIRVFQKKYGETVAGRKVEIILKDDGGTKPETTKQLAQELVTKDKVDILAGFGLTPLALAAAPVATQSKKPMIVMAAATSVVTQKSPYIVRSSFTLPQITAPLGDWLGKNSKLKTKTIITLVSDYGPGIDAEKAFVKHFTDAGGKVVDSLRVPLMNPDFSPFMQKVKDAKPDAVFVFVPSGEGSNLIKQYAEKGLDKAGIIIVCTGDVLDDNQLPSMNSSAVGIYSTHHYSAAHESAENKAYVAEFTKLSNGMRPNFHSVGGYDGMYLIYEALKKTGGDADGDKLLEAMKSLKWTSPRGPVSIDPATREMIQTVYFRRSEMVNGQIYNIEFDKVENFKDPGN
jgi:branched-chain amino acid transport system substrate-binding protein